MVPKKKRMSGRLFTFGEREVAGKLLPSMADLVKIAFHAQRLDISAGETARAKCSSPVRCHNQVLLDQDRSVHSTTKQGDTLGSEVCKKIAARRLPRENKNTL
jgi:hypothetical protein